MKVCMCSFDQLLSAFHASVEIQVRNGSLVPDILGFGRVGKDRCAPMSWIVCLGASPPLPALTKWYAETPDRWYL